MEAEPRWMLEDGHKPGEIARELRVGRATVYRHLKPLGS
ncbi:MAG: helix-turn-helix domain-containing protein [Pseudonocardiales bacterium]|nr:helix-turn-helix domain-containing protein [Pseudonocardiales bacterium]